MIQQETAATCQLWFLQFCSCIFPGSLLFLPPPFLPCNIYALLFSSQTTWKKINSRNFWVTNIYKEFIFHTEPENHPKVFFGDINVMCSRTIFKTYNSWFCCILIYLSLDFIVKWWKSSIFLLRIWMPFIGQFSLWCYRLWI